MAAIYGNDGCKGTNSLTSMPQITIADLVCPSCGHKERAMFAQYNQRGCPECGSVLRR